MICTIQTEEGYIEIGDTDSTVDEMFQLWKQAMGGLGYQIDELELYNPKQL